VSCDSPLVGQGSGFFGSVLVLDLFGFGGLDVLPSIV
jgi:hypothetical protein